MPHQTIEQFLRKQPDDNLGKICMIKGKELLSGKKDSKLKMTYLEKKERKRQRERNYCKALRLTPEGKKLLSERGKKNYWKHLQYHKIRKKIWYQANKEEINARKKAKKIILDYVT